MTPSHRRREVPRFAALVLLCSLFTPLLATELLHDFDGDGRDEKLVSTPTSSHIDQRNKSGAWERADYALPEGLSPMDAAGGDAGLRFVDLNEDGFDDILFCNDEKLVIHLWNTTVKPALGWTKGWSQKVRAETKKDSTDILPSLVGKIVRAEDGDLIVEGVSEKWKLRDLIAFDIPKPLSPEEALEAFTVRPGFEVELVASEPVVVDPVAMNWDEVGNLWVVEMRDYPLGIDGKGKPGGVIKKLQDRDGDGHYEDHTLFLEGLTYPTGVFPWGKGVLYTATPDIVYAEDTDGDGSADTREVLFTGFRPGNQQHLVNGFEWGLDGWIYVANGDSGGTVKSLQTGKELSIRGRDFRFKPDTGEMETVSAQTQFGLRRDDWGNWFGNNNSIWLWHVVMPEHYLRRNPKLAVKSVRRTITDYPEATRVFPTSSAIERPNQPWSLNHVTSACSPVLYRDDFFGTDFARTAWISEPVHNLIHREVLIPEGVSFRSERAKGEERSEFLSSSDHWFRPTGLSIGPDGCLYIADMYRFVIEHPEWISPEMQSRIDLRAGEDKGRIYRVKPAGKARRPIPHLADLSPVELVRAMNSASGWQRDTAMRLLKDRNSSEGIAELNALTRPPHAPQVRVQALATLGYLEALTEDHLIEGLSDPHSEVKIEALRQTDGYLPKSDRLFHAM
ncbi:MAG: dehydrogenase, partial [Verrucomicrobiaceae bacterium]|nr:dehydrogenase [Verrucomicrobiaceae bacterium]